eukprot:70244-Chlamydomonas_euryale.AAC.3
MSGNSARLAVPRFRPLSPMCMAMSRSGVFLRFCAAAPRRRTGGDRIAMLVAPVRTSAPRTSHATKRPPIPQTYPYEALYTLHWQAALLTSPVTASQPTCVQVFLRRQQRPERPSPPRPRTFCVQ